MVFESAGCFDNDNDNDIGRYLYLYYLNTKSERSSHDVVGV